MGFRENVLLTLVSIAIFAYSCTQIILDKSYVFDILIENYNLRVSFLLIYIVSFVTLFGFSLSHYYYKNAKKKAHDAKKTALSAYLEAKNIKRQYLLDNDNNSEMSEMSEMSEITELHE